MPERPVPVALTIAGSDSGGGAGIEADLKTFTALGVYGMAAVTAVTAQNTTGVFGVQELEPGIVAQQIDVVVEDIGVDAAKTGMLSNVEIVEAVADAVARAGIDNLVVDPVMVAKSGDLLLAESARRALETKIVPLAYVITPNVHEAEALAGTAIRNEEDLRDAARRIHDLGPRYVLMKGGHLPGENATDYLFDGSRFETFTAPRIHTKNTHGTGCTYSAAIAAGLAKGLDVLSAVRTAKGYLTAAIQNAFDLGKGHGPLNHMAPHES